jgi:hypothetical protein
MFLAEVLKGVKTSPPARYDCKDYQRLGNAICASTPMGSILKILCLFPRILLKHVLSEEILT